MPEILSRLLRALRQDIQRRDRRTEILERRLPCFERDASSPAECCAVIALGVLIAQAQTDPQRVAEPDAR